MAYKHEIWSYRIYKKKLLIIAHSGVSSDTRCLKEFQSLLQLAYFVYAGTESPGEVIFTCRLVGAFATHGCNKNISCADQYIVLIFHCRPLFYFNHEFYKKGLNN